MKRHLLLTTALLLASCRTDKEILHTADTVYIARQRDDRPLYHHRNQRRHSIRRPPDNRIPLSFTHRHYAPVSYRYCMHNHIQGSTQQK